MNRNLLRAGLALLILSGLSACAGIRLQDPYQAFGNNLASRNAVNEEAVSTVGANLRCRPGMRVVSNTIDLESQMDITYDESHGDRRGGGYRDRGSRSPYTSYNGANVQVRAEASASGNGKVRCEIDLNPGAPATPRR